MSSHWLVAQVMTTNFNLYWDGIMYQKESIRFSLSQRLNLRGFPFDEHVLVCIHSGCSSRECPGQKGLGLAVSETDVCDYLSKSETLNLVQKSRVIDCQSHAIGFMESREL